MPIKAGKIEVLPYNELWSLLDRAGFAVARLREIELSHFNLTIEQSSILYILHNKGSSMTIEELEDITMRQPHSVSTLINRMIRAGLLRREKCQDSKKSSIHITGAGNTALKNLTSDSLELAFSIFTDTEKKQLNHILDKLLKKSRQLLGISSLPPFLLYVNHNNHIKNSINIVNSNKLVSDYEVWASINRTRFAIARLRELELAHFNLTLEQSSILHIIYNHGSPATIEELQDITMRQPHSILSLINRMISAGLLKKETIPAGKRYFFSLSPKGKTLFQRLTMISLEMPLSTLSDKEKRQLTSILTRILERTRHLLGVSSYPPFMQYINQEPAVEKN